MYHSMLLAVARTQTNTKTRKKIEWPPSAKPVPLGGCELVLFCVSPNIPVMLWVVCLWYYKNPMNGPQLAHLGLQEASVVLICSAVIKQLFTCWMFWLELPSSCPKMNYHCLLESKMVELNAVWPHEEKLCGPPQHWNGSPTSAKMWIKKTSS